MANRHGLDTRAMGTSKTVTLQTVAEAFSRRGLPVFIADRQGRPGRHQLTEVLKECGIEPGCAVRPVLTAMPAAIALRHSSPGLAP